MKLGSLVRTSMTPLNAPSASVTSSDTPTPTQVLAVIWKLSIDEISAELVTITPADRSNSPPIISSATGTAMMPIVEDAYSTVPMLDAWRKESATSEKNRKTAAAPTTAPSSGRPSSRRASDRGASRSSMPESRTSSRAHRVPRLAYASSACASSLVTICGPVRTGWPPPRVSLL